MLTTPRPFSSPTQRHIGAGVFIIVLAVALGLRLLTYDRYLPFIDYTDEAVYAALGQDIRGLSDESALRATYGAIPPLYSYLNAAVQIGWDAIKPHNWNLIAEYYVVLRLLAVALGVLTALVLVWAAAQIAGWGAGLLAGLVWAAAPIIVEFNSLAIPDPTVYLSSALALGAGVCAWRSGARWALGLALLAAIIIVYAKYWVITMTLPFVIVSMALLWRQPRRMLPFLIVTGSIALAAAVYLLVVVQPGNLPRKAYFDLRTIIDVDRNFNNLWHALYPIGVPVYVAGLLAGGVAYLISRRRGYPLVDARFVGLIALIAVLGVPLTSAISNVILDEAGRIRHILPTGTAFYVLWGVALGQVVWLLQAAYPAKPGRGGWRRLLPAVPILVALAALLPGYGAGNAALIAQFNRPHATNLLRDWADRALPADGLVMQPYDSDLDRTWNRIWGGYAGDHPLLYWSETADQISASTPASYAARDIRYLIINDEDLTTGKYNTPGVRAFLDQLLLLKVFPVNPATTAGSTTYAYQMLLPQYPAAFTFGDQIVLKGYDLSATTAAAGETLEFRPYWGIQQPPQANYSMFVHLYPAATLDLQAQQDGTLVPFERPTQTWTDPQETFIGRTTQLPLPADLPAGAYRLAVGVYDYTSFARLRQGEADFFAIPIRVR